ncbi:hypothetical protein QYF36_016277 [Acer negundo]|nr:hypothetical protein QYF36_016277 [Acer negundo]
MHQKLPHLLPRMDPTIPTKTIRQGTYTSNVIAAIPQGHTNDVCRKLKKTTSHGDKIDHQDKKNASFIFPSKAHHVDSKSENADAPPSSYKLTAD